jgi:hypothetical protein
MVEELVKFTYWYSNYEEGSGGGGGGGGGGGVPLEELDALYDGGASMTPASTDATEELEATLMNFTACTCSLLNQ